MYREHRYPPPFHFGHARTREVRCTLAWGIASCSCCLLVPQWLFVILSQILSVGPVSLLLPVHPLRRSYVQTLPLRVKLLPWVLSRGSPLVSLKWHPCSPWSDGVR